LFRQPQRQNPLIPPQRQNPLIPPQRQNPLTPLQRQNPLTPPQRQNPLTPPQRQNPQQKKIKPQPVKTEGKPNIPTYSEMSETDQGRIREDFRIKFGILRSSFNHLNIPLPTEQESLETIHAKYDQYIRHIHVSGSVDQYKIYLIILFLGIELFCTKILNLDMGGFTINQLSSMNRYERLLIELGERNYNSGSSSWPVEIRILVIALVNAIIFLIVKTFAGFLGPDVANMIQNIITNILSGNSQPKVKEDGTIDPSVTSGNGGGLGGLDLGSLLGSLGGFLGNNKSKSTPAPQTSEERKPRRPRYTE
jgi:hypothetical protein